MRRLKVAMRVPLTLPPQKIRERICKMRRRQSSVADIAKQLRLAPDTVMAVLVIAAKHEPGLLVEGPKETHETIRARKKANQPIVERINQKWGSEVATLDPKGFVISRTVNGAPVNG